MSKTKIEWTDYSYNPITGCTKGCSYCYARRMTERNLWGYDFTPQLHADRLKKHRNWKPNERVFVCDMGDLFDPQVEHIWISQVFEVFKAYPGTHFQLLTKQIERMYDYAQSYGKLPDNVWWGCTVTNQDDADTRIPILLKLKNLGAAVVYISCEPLLGAIDLLPFSDISLHRFGFMDEPPLKPSQEVNEIVSLPLDWVIAGGQSGRNAEPMHPAWPRDLRDQCVEAGVPFFFKQWGEWCVYPSHTELKGRESIALASDGSVNVNRDCGMHLIGKKAAGRLLDGIEWNQMPLKEDKDIFHDSEISAEGFHFDIKRADENLKWLRKQQLKENTDAP